MNTISIEPTINTERLHLRPIQSADAAAVFAYRSDAHTNRYQGFIPKELKDVDAFIAKNPRSWNERDTWFQLVLMERESNTLIGDLGVHFLADGLQCELGCTLHIEWQGKGFANEAMKAVISHLFTDLGKHRITASVDPKNEASIRMLERLGFRKEAYFKESILHNGEWVDDVVFGMLQREWIF